MRRDWSKIPRSPRPIGTKAIGGNPKHTIIAKIVTRLEGQYNTDHSGLYLELSLRCGGFASRVMYANGAADLYILKRTKRRDRHCA